MNIRTLLPWSLCLLAFAPGIGAWMTLLTPTDNPAALLGDDQEEATQR